MNKSTKQIINSQTSLISPNSQYNSKTKMGCSDSTAIDNHLHLRNQTAINPHQFPTQNTDSLPPSSDIKAHTKESQVYNGLKKQPSYGEDLFQNSQEYLEQLYNVCEGNLDKFFSELQEKISQIYMSISKDTLEQMNQNVLINNESKIQISEQILWFNLNILKVASRKSEHKFNPTIFKQINKLQKNLVGYLKMKYPRGGQSFVPGDLMAVFKEFDLSEDLEFDILKNANIYFGSQEDADLSRDIKIFLNKLMNETDLNYPKFEKMMQERVFVVEEQDGEKKTLNYKIGRKIPQNVPKYTDLDNNTLEINSPQIFRVIIKWMEYLQQTLISPNENINKKKNFKCFIEQTSLGVNVYDEINEDEYYDLINYQLIEKIEKEKVNFSDENAGLLKDMDRFNSHLIKLLDTSVRRQKFVPVREMETIKYSNLNAKFIAWVLGEKLMLALKKLIKVGKSFYETRSMLNLDLIQFKVSDLMRSMVSGSKKQILAVYANLKNLQKQGQIKIIKIKNRLGTSLNDAMIIFAMKDTFLICEIQLILSDSTQKVNQKYKNIELLNHFFYELQRSPYGILSEIAVLLAYKDSKVSYEDNITFELNPISITKCQSTHPNHVQQIRQQSKPFICTKCTKFYFKFENIFVMKHCEMCNVFVCAKCIFQADKELEKAMVGRELSVEIEKVVGKTLTKLRNIKASIGASTILEVFDDKFKRLQEIFGPKKVQTSKFREYLSQQIKNASSDFYFVLVGFRTGSAVFKQYIFKPMWKQIVNPFSPKQNFNDKKFLFYTSYDMILFYRPGIIKQQNKEWWSDVSDNMLHLYSTEEDLNKVFVRKSGLMLTTLKVADFRLVVNFEKQVKKQIGQIVQDRQDASWKGWKNKCTKNFKFVSLHEATAGLPDLAGAKSLLKLSDLGIIDTHLNFFKQMNWALSIKELKLSKNKLTSVAIILEVCTKIERLYINQNFIRELAFTKDLPDIEIINGVNNEILVVKGTEKIKNISKLLLQGNKLCEFPKCEFPNLKILNLKRNPICNFESVYQSKLPNIQQMYLDYEEENQNSHTRPNNEVNLEKVVLPFTKLRSIQSESNFTTIQIESPKIQRINFYRNDLKYITLKSFECLKYVTLSDNQIENIDFLFSPKNNNQNNTILQINMKRNKLIQLPIMKSTSLTIANFSQNQITHLDNLTHSTLPNLTTLHFYYNNITQISEMSFPKLTSLQLSNNPITKMQKLQTSKLDSLQSLDFSWCGIIEVFPLLNLPNLDRFAIMQSEIRQMENLAMARLPKLKLIKFEICTIDKFPVLSMDSLQTIDLSHSTIGNLVNLQKSQLKSLKQLILFHVKIQDSQIQPEPQQPSTTLPNKNSLATSFSCNLNFPKLQTLKLDGANFKNMQGLQKSLLPTINELSISSCVFTTYPKLCLKSLKKLTAQFCQIRNIESLLTSQLSALEVINFRSNLIESVSLNLPKIKVVDLSENLIKEFIQVGALDDLEELNLEKNGLTVFPVLKAPVLKKLMVYDNAFVEIGNLASSQLDGLEELRLDKCHLGSAPFPIVKLPAIKSLYVLESQVADVSNLTQCKMPLIEDINFTLNNVKILPLMKFPQLKFLRFNQNSITDVSALQYFQCPQLTIIQLQTNQVTTLPKLPFPNLSKLFIHQNNITQLSGFNQSQFKDLKIINMCQSLQLQQWPMPKNGCQQVYIDRTKLNSVIKVHEYKNLRIIYMNGNQVTHVPKLNIRQLEMIQFQDNLITDISEFATGEYPQCHLLSFKGNQITKVPKINMPKLKKVYFNENAITDVDEFLESEMLDLELLTLEKNNIKRVKKLPYPNLNDVYLTSNRELEELTCFILPEYNQLKMIVAASTSISKVQKLPKMLALQKIWVNDSKVQSLDWLAASAPNLPKLSFFNGSDNEIKTLPALQFKSLSSLYMTNNPLQDIDKFIKCETMNWSGLYTCNVSYKCQSDEEFEKKRVEAMQKSYSFNLYRYY